MHDDPSQALEEIIEWIRGRYFGKYRGVVTDNDDPFRRGRLEVEVPAVFGSEAAWAMPCVPYAGAGVGFHSLPDPGAGVWVEFEGGDPSFPVWTGCFWAAGELPPDRGPEVKAWYTEKLTLRLDAGSGEAALETLAGASHVLRDAAVTTTSGDSELTVTPEEIQARSGAKKAVVSAASFAVNDGAFEVV